MLRILLVFFIVVSCTEKNDPSPAPKEPAEPNQSLQPKDTSSAVKVKPKAPMAVLPEVPGMTFDYMAAEEKDGHYLVSGLKVIESSASFPVDAFPEEVWGPLAVKFRDKEFDINFSDEFKDFKVTYHSPSKEKIQTTNHCQWKEKETAAPVKEMSMTDLDASVYKKILGAAESGHKQAFDSVMALKVTKEIPKDLIAAQKRFRYMAAHGCNWK